MDSISTTKHFPGFDRLYHLDFPIVHGAYVPKLVMEYDQGQLARLEKKYQEEEAQRLSEIVDDPKELLYAKLSKGQITALKRAKAHLLLAFARELSSGRAEVSTPLRVEWQGGRAKPADVESCNIDVFSGKVKGLFEEHGITGWKAYPIDLYDKLGRLVEGYSVLGITGRCGPLDPTKAVKRLTEYPGGIFPAYYGHYFDPESWDGSDIFMSSSSGHINITERVKKLLEKHKIKHVAVDTNLVDLVWEGFEIMHPELAKQSS